MNPFVLAFVYTMVVHQQGDKNPVLCFCELFEILGPLTKPPAHQPRASKSIRLFLPHPTPLTTSREPPHSVIRSSPKSSPRAFCALAVFAFPCYLRSTFTSAGALS